MLKKIKKWFQNLGKEKCPNCGLIGFDENILKKTFIEKKTVSRAYQKVDRGSIMRGSSNHPRDGSFTTEFYDEEVSIYNMDYLCNNCKYVIQKIANIGDAKVLMSFSEYQKTLGNSND